MENKRKRFGPEEKAGALRRHLVDKAAVSEVCEEYGIQPTVFYQWQKRLFENAASLFERPSTNRDRREAERVEALEAKLRRKDEVLGSLWRSTWR